MHLYQGLVLKYCLITHDARIGSSPGRVVGNTVAILTPGSHLTLGRLSMPTLLQDLPARGQAGHRLKTPRSQVALWH